MKLLALDGNSILNRAFYGIRSLSTKDGVFTNAIYGFLMIMDHIMQETQPDAIAVTFDMRAPTFRHKMYKDYKGNRKGMPDELAQQMPLLKELLNYLGYAMVEKEGFEADDLLGTLSRACLDNGHECIIATGDRDSFQLINSNVTVRLTSTKGGGTVSEIYDIQAIQEKYGIAPKQHIDVKALMGDSSDNVPGVAGIGEKTALSLIQTFGSMENLYASLDDPSIKLNIRKKLEDGKAVAEISKALVTINCHAPIETGIDNYLRSEIDASNALSLMTRLELYSLIDKYGIQAQQKQTECDAPKTNGNKNINIVMNDYPSSLLKDGNTVDVIFQIHSEQFEITSLCLITRDALYLINEDAPIKAEQILASPAKKRTVGSKRLYRFALNKQIDANNIVFDMEIAGYILNPNSSDYSTHRLALEYGVDSAVNTSNNSMPAGFIEECAVFSKLADVLTDKMEENQQLSLFSEVEMPLARVLADMEHIGIAINKNALVTYGQELDKYIDNAARTIYNLAGEEFNINSTQQLGAILFEKLNLPSGKKNKSGYSTKAEVLEAIVDQHEIVGYILQYRTMVKLKSTYVDGLLKSIGDDGRIHSSFQQTLTKTGRISSAEPNIQNIPIRTKLGSMLRRFFCAANGCELIDADYSQIELRVLAHIAGDVNMTSAFICDQDIHRQTASQVFITPFDDVTPLMRTRAKAVNFGIVYGIGSFSLSKDIGVGMAEAKRYIQSYLDTFYGVKEYMDNIIVAATNSGYVETILHRRRYLPELSSSNRVTREFGKRVAMNTPIQGTAADIIKIAMVKVWQRLRAENLHSKLILQVHDELIIESPANEVEKVKALLKSEMENAMELDAPLIADVGSGDTWMAAKG